MVGIIVFINHVWNLELGLLSLTHSSNLSTTEYDAANSSGLPIGCLSTLASMTEDVG